MYFHRALSVTLMSNMTLKGEKRPLLNSFTLIQYVREATHSVGHTLDFIITHNDDRLATSVEVGPVSVSHHHIVC